MSVTYDLIALGLEQGTISSDGPSPSTTRVRSIDFIEFPYVGTRVIQVTATGANVSKLLQVNFVGYDASYNELCDLYWYNLAFTFDLTSYPTVKYFKILFRYSDDTTITPADIVTAQADVFYWYLNISDRLSIDELPGNIIGGPVLSTSTPPMYGYPATYWHYDFVTDKLILNNVCYSYFMSIPIVDENRSRNDFVPLTNPYPASFWWYDEEVVRLRNVLIPDALLMPEPTGAFYNAESLESVKIPMSVTSIGWDSFAHTKLKEVMLSRNCKFSTSAFPPGCRVLYYEDMYDQNYNITVEGTESFRCTETVTHDEESTTCEIP